MKQNMKRDALDELIDWQEFCASYQLRQNRRKVRRFDAFLLTCVIFVCFALVGMWLACMEDEDARQLKTFPATGGLVAK